MRQSLNLWCAIWFWAKPGKTITVHKNNKERQLEVPDVPTTQKYLELVSSLDSPEESEKYRDYFDVLDHIVEKHRFFHWELEFPEIWQKITGDPAASNYGFDVIIGNPPWEVPEAEPKEFSASQYPEVNDLSRDKFKKWFENQLKTDVDFKAKWLEVVRERNLLVRGYKNLLPEGERIVREANLYKGFILRSVWAKPRRLGFIVPSSFHTDASTLPLREVTLLDCNSSLVAITNDALIFPSLPAIFRFDIFACDLEDKNTKLSIAYLPAAITSHLQPEYIKQKMYQLNLNDINQLAPGLLSVPEFQDKDSYNITTKAYRNGVALGMLEPDGKVLFKKEAYNTNEHDGGALVYSGWDVPFCEGATVKPYLWRLSSAEKGYKEDIFSSRFIDHETVWNWRLAFKLIVSQSNVRRMQVCLVPPKTVFGQNVPTLSMHGASLEETVSLLGVLNSFVFEYLVRMKTGAALSKPVLMSLPIPKNTFTDTNFPHYVKTALMGIEGQPRNIIEHLNLHNSNKLLIYYQARAIIDSIVAQSYGLNEKEYASVLRVFNLLDKDQPALPNEEKSYVTRDYAFLEFFNLHKKDAPKDITPFFQVENPRGIILGLEDRVNKAFDLGARPYSQSNLDAENEDGDVYDFDTE